MLPICNDNREVWYILHSKQTLRSETYCKSPRGVCRFAKVVKAGHLDSASGS